MTLSTLTPESIVTKTFQAGLWVAMPVTVYAMGGPVAIWNEGGIMVKILLAANILPAAICAPAAVESLVRTTSLGLKYINASSHYYEQLENKEALSHEFRRTTGMARATLFPISGWAVVAKLPVQDYYVYIIPKEAMKKTGSAFKKGAKAVNNVLVAIKFWDGLEFTIIHAVVPVCKHVAVPVGKHVVIPVYKVVASVANAAIRLLSASLGAR